MLIYKCMNYKWIAFSAIALALFVQVMSAGAIIISLKDIEAGDELTANYNLYTYPKTGIGIQTF